MEDNKNRTGVSLRLNDGQVAMLDAIKNSLSLNSRAQALIYSMNVVYKKTFPSYTGKPTSMPVVGGGVGQAKQAQVVAQARVQNKTALEQAQKEEIVNNGKHVCEVYLGGKMTGIGGAVDAMTCTTKMISNLEAKEHFMPLPITAIPISGEWNSDVGIRMFCFKHVFKNVDIENLDEAKVKKSLASELVSFTLGVERGKITPEDISVYVVNYFFELCDERNIDTKKARALVANEGWK